MSADLLRDLYWNGFARLPDQWQPAWVDEYIAHLKERPVFTGHVVPQGDGIPRTWQSAADRELLTYEMESTITAPHFFEFATEFTALIEDYFREPALMYSFNAFWTRPGKDPVNPNIQDWHRDRDDRKFIALFMYGSDVLDDNHGPHLYAKGSHRNNDGQHRKPYEPIERIYGKAGSFFFTDPSGLHFGEKPRVGERLLAWARWGVSNPPQSYNWDRLKPIAASKLPLTRAHSETVKRSTALVVDWNA